MNEINMQVIRGHIDEHRDEIIADLMAFVERETPSGGKGLLDAFTDYLAEYGYCTVSEPRGPGRTPRMSTSCSPACWSGRP